MPRWPEFYPSRSGATITISLINPNPAFSSIYIDRAEEGVDHNNMSTIARVDIANFPYQDTVPDATKRYKYSLAYADIESNEIWDESLEVWDTSTEVWFQDNGAQVKSITKFTEKDDDGGS